MTVPTDDEFRTEVREWLTANVGDDRGGGVAWNQHLATDDWTCIGWPVEHGGRGLDLAQQVIFHEEYALAQAPERINHLGEELLGPTLIAHGTDAQKARFLPRIKDVTELWCQGYSEPGAGSDLANVQTKARLVGDEWIIEGQKVWTSNAHVADWIFLLARTEPGSQRHHGLSFLLVPLDQEGVEVRPIEQLTGESEFNEVFFTGAHTSSDLVVGEPGQGWAVAMALLGFERELADLVALARGNGTFDDPVLRDRLARAKVGLAVMKANVVRTLLDPQPGSESIAKLVWANWHRELGELAMAIAGPAGLVAEPRLDAWQRLFLFSRADTIYGGSDEIQRNILAERVLGLPREPRG